MTVNVSKPALNVREKLAELDKPTGIAGEAMLRAETPQEQFNLIGAGRRNLIINGDMRIAQRGTSSSTPADQGYTNVDRFLVYRNGAGVLSIAQSAVAPDGFQNSLLVQCDTADTSIAGNDFGGVAYYVEAQDLVGTAFGTPSAKPLTLSFWVRANLTGLYSVAIRQPNATVDSYVDTYTINAVDTWEYKTITIAPDASIGNWTLTGNGRGLQVCFALWNGGSYGGAEYGKWLGNTNDVGSSENVNFVSSTSNIFRITGVQLELGKVATPFEHRSYGEELALCQRYYHKFDLISFQRLAIGYSDINNRAIAPMFLPVPLRTLASYGEGSITVNGYDVTSFSIQHKDNSAHLSGTFTIGNTNLTVGNAYQIYAPSGGAFVYVDGEL